MRPSQRRLFAENSTYDDVYTFDAEEKWPAGLIFHELNVRSPRHLAENSSNNFDRGYAMSRVCVSDVRINMF